MWGDRATAVGTPPLWQALGWEGQEVLSDSPLNPVQNVAANLVSFTPRRLNRHEREGPGTWVRRYPCDSQVFVHEFTVRS